MAQITLNTKFIGIERDLVDLIEKKSGLVNDKQHPFSIKDISQAGRVVVDRILTVAGWTLVNGLYEQTLLNGRITSDSYVAVIPFNADVAIVSAAGILPQNDSIDGGVIIYSTNLPSDDINVTLNIFL
jgi:hypothetical protein